MLTSLRPAIRGLLRTPGATLISMTVLALCIGTAMGLFSLYHALVLRPLPVPDSGQLVHVGVRHPGAEPRGLCPLDVADLARAPGLLREPFYYSSMPYQTRGSQGSRVVPVAFVSENFFDALRPRFLEGGPSPDGVVVSEDHFAACFGADARLSGQRLEIAGVALPVVGIVARPFRGLHPGESQAVWVPPTWMERIDPVGAKLARTRYTDDGSISCFARLHAGASLDQAEASLAGFAASWAEQLPATHKGVRLELKPLNHDGQALWEGFLPQRRLLAAALGLLGLLGALNVVQLQLARWTGRRIELATRLALGATRRSLLNDLGAELAVLVSAAGLLALPTGLLVTRWLARLQPPSEFPLQIDVTMGVPVFLFLAALLALLVLVLGGCVGLWLLKDRTAESLRIGAGHLGSRRTWRGALLGFQLALALGLLGTTLPILNSLYLAYTAPLGYQPKGMYAVSVAPPWFLGKGVAFRGTWIRLVDRLRTQGLVSGAMLPPLEALGLSGNVTSDGGTSAFCQRNYVQPGFFEVVGIPMLEGRAIDARDGEDAPRAAVVDRMLAQALWPGQSALGRTLELLPGKPITVVGVCAPFRMQDPKQPPQPLLLMSQRQGGQVLFSLLVRSAMPEPHLRRWLEREVAAVDSRLAVLRAEPLTDRLDRHLQPLRLGATLMGGLSVLALVLSAAGTFGLQSLVAAQRKREYALRAAVGATRSCLLRASLRGTMVPAIAGLAGGALLAVALRQMLSNLLGPLGHVNMTVLVGSAVLLFVTALAAAMVPALRAARVQPAEALKVE